jgi:hypothetical protein
MRDIEGNKIAAYRYGPYMFQVIERKGYERIHGLSGCTFDTERELCQAYDSANGADRTDGPGLKRVYADGSESVLRKGDNNNEN